MHISKFSVRLVALLAVVAGFMLALNSLGGGTQSVQATGNISGVSCADIYLDIPPANVKGTAHDAEDLRVAKSITRVIDPGGAAVRNVTVVTISYLGYDGPDADPIPDAPPADPCQTKADGGGNFDSRIKYAQVNVNNRVAAPVTGTWDSNTSTLTFKTCTFSESLGTWVRTDVQSHINGAKDPLVKNFGDVTLYTDAGSPTVPSDPTTCSIAGATPFVDAFPSVIESIARAPTTDANPIVAPAVIDPDGTQATNPGDKIPVPQPPDGDALDDDWDADGCTDHDELAPSNADNLLAGRDPFNPTDCTPNPSGVYNILATVAPAAKDGSGNLVPGTYFHCIAQVNKAGANLTGSLVCYQDSPGLSGASGSAVPSHSDGLAGAPPPPPYTSGAPTPLTGTWDSVAQTATITSCFRNVGGVIAPNVIATATFNLKTFKGTTDIHGNQSNTACNALTPVQHPGVIIKLTGVPIQIARQATDFDHDQDGCTDADELTAAATPKCGDDPYNPLDSDASLNSLASVLVTQTAADINEGTGAIISGVYFHCIADIQQATKALTSRLECYTDNPALVVNPPATGTAGNDNDGVPDNNDICGVSPLQPASQCGDGVAGSAPPAPFADIDSTHIVFSGTGNNIDNGTNLIHIEGCLSGVDNEALGGAGHNVYARATIALHNGAMVSNGGPTAATAMNAGQGLVDIWLAQATCAKPGGAPSIDDAAIEIAEQGTKTGLTAPNQWDTDLDGCTDKQELRDTKATGGLRDPYNRWDFMDQYIGAPLAKDRTIAVGDIGAVVKRFGTAGSATGDPNQTPANATGYHTSADRNGSLPGSNSWNLKPPDGIVAVGDIGAVVAQFGHGCTT